MFCLSVLGDHPQALVSGLSPVHMHTPYNNFLIVQHAFYFSTDVSKSLGDI